MSKHLLSAKIYIYISLIACLMTLAINDQEGNFLLTGFEKKWKVILNDEQNAKLLADKLKSEKEIPIIFELVAITYGAGKREAYCTNLTDHYFNFESANNIANFQPYDIAAWSESNNDQIFIYLENKDDVPSGIKIGQLINGANDPSDLNSAVIDKIANMKGQIPFETFILSYSDEDESDEVEISDVSDGNCKISWVIVLLSGTGLLAVCLFLYFIRFR